MVITYLPLVIVVGATNNSQHTNKLVRRVMLSHDCSKLLTIRFCDYNNSIQLMDVRTFTKIYELLCAETKGRSSTTVFSYYI